MAVISAIYSSPYAQKSKKQRKRDRDIQRELKLHVRAKALRDKLVANATPAEIAFQHILVDLRIPFQFQREMRRKNNKLAIVDFYLPGIHTIVEIDGGYHENQVQSFLDQQRVKEILKHNRKPESVIRFSNHQVLEHPDEVKRVLQDRCDRLS